MTDSQNSPTERNGKPYSVERLEFSISCPDCDEVWEFANINEEIARKVDAALHYVEEHDEEIPDEAEFGDNQCPTCFDILGLNGTASCSECGYVPEEVVA